MNAMAIVGDKLKPDLQCTKTLPARRRRRRRRKRLCHNILQYHILPSHFVHFCYQVSFLLKTCKNTATASDFEGHSLFLLLLSWGRRWNVKKVDQWLTSIEFCTKSCASTGVSEECASWKGEEFWKKKKKMITQTEPFGAAFSTSNKVYLEDSTFGSTTMKK